ncbi:DHH family phosphoesterase [Peribacillus asahii]|uniref:Oligoribonuclease n=1 Tax=Peribacillus asahii TaxID=228899 RepID=A0A3T0KLY9_9BACI|nr:oligoribonuclease [Peribacillus asahii]AZV41274.1 oligoribonuclease [Peribacillus asahii]USK85639.1 oligoribonuclease [Peribacillus asahii]
MYHLFTHNDLDGVGCGIVAKLAFGEDVQVSYNSIGRLNYQVEAFLEQADKEQRLLVTDLSVNEENEQRISQFVANGGSATLIDHHKTALHLNAHPWANVTVEREDGKLASATSLFYEYAVQQNWLSRSQNVEEFVELVRQYDTWEWEANQNLTAKRLNDLFFMFSIEEFEGKITNKLANADSFDFDEVEETLLKVEESRVDRYIKRKKREVYQVAVGPHVAGVVHAESYHSELGNELSKEYNHLDYIAIAMVGSKRLSLRTIHDDIDVSSVAGKYEGGGHQKAAGCNLTEQAFKQFIEQTFYSEPIKRDAHNNQINLKESQTGSLYTTKDKQLLFLKPNEQNEWGLEINHKQQSQTFTTFQEAERYIKRRFGAWLAYDEPYEEYIKKA